MKIAELLQRIVAELEIPCNNCLEFLMTMEATWLQLSKQTTMMHDIVKSDTDNTDSITLKKVRNYFQIKMSWIKGLVLK